MSIKWKDTKRHFGLPISFTNYSLTENRLFRKSGILTRKEDQVSLYHIRDMEVSISLGQRIFGVGTVKVIGSDASTPELLLENIKKPYEVRDLLYETSEEDKKNRRLTRTEFMYDDYSDYDDYPDME